MEPAEQDTKTRTAFSGQTIVIPAAQEPPAAGDGSLYPLARWQWRIVVEDYNDEWIEHTLEDAISRVAFEMEACSNKIRIERTQPSSVLMSHREQ